MTDVDSMSDAELRSKLMEFGFPVMPITGTTRKVMAKKLKILLETKNKGNKDNRKSLGRYSSDEESDMDIKSIKKNEIKRRATMGGPMNPPVTNKITMRKRGDSNSSANNEVPLPPPSLQQQQQQAPHKEMKTIKTSTTTTRTTKILEAAAKDEYDTGSESDEVADNYSSFNTSVHRESPVLSQNRVTTTTTKDYSPPQPMETSYGGRLSTSPSRLSSSTYATGPSAAEERLQQIRSRLSLTSHYDRPMFTSSPLVDESINNKEETPFLSNFTKRLSQLREDPKLNVGNEYKSEIKENDSNGGGFSAKNYLSSYRSTRGRTTNYDYNKQQQQSNNGNIFKDKYISVMVLGAAFLFFIFLAVVYLGIRSDTALETTATVPLCGGKYKSPNCINREDKSSALDLLKILLPKLREQAVEYRCNRNNIINNKIKPYLTENEIINYIKKEYLIEKEERIRIDLKNVEILTFFNNIWGVNLILLNDENDDFEIAEDIESAENSDKLKGLIILNSSLPWSCYLYEKFTTLFSFIITISIGVLVLYFLNYCYKYWRFYQQQQKEEELQIVEHVIEVLQANDSESSSEDNYLVINHVRDMILPLNERKRLERVWARAVKYIDENESRIRREIQVVKGEPAEVWRWLGGPNISIGGSSRNKSWQGQAFETQVGSVNSLPCSPTPCLKIRGMVEEGDRNVHLIKRAVLNKCANECRILHCAVDTKLNCVYLKCAGTQDAAVAYRNLHGWWYAGNLVTVKYIRLERYMQRFPDSPSSGPYLKTND